MNTKNQKYDDLTSIKGIGHARQEWLKNKLGVHTYRDLADLSPETILSQLKSDGLIVSRGEVEKWIVQAQELAHQNRESSPDDWEPFASFVVEFQARRGKTDSRELCTTVQHMEADKEEMWPGIETEQLCHWMRDQLGIGVRQEEKQQTTASTKLPTIAVNQIQAFQPPHAVKPSAISMPGWPFQGFIRGDKPFDLLEDFSITGLGPGDLQQRRVSCLVRFYTCKLPLGKWIHLGDAEPLTLVEGQVIYTAILSGNSLPEGMYLLRVVTKIQSEPPVAIHHEVPMLHVV